MLKQETAARIRTDWELQVQSTVLDALSAVKEGGLERFEVTHPVAAQGRLATVEVTVGTVREVGYEADEVLIQILPEGRYASSQLLWQLTVRVLISVDPPEQGWDRYGDTYSNIGEPGAWSKRVNALRLLVEKNELAVSEPGSSSHYAHREHLAGKAIQGEAVRALCGVYFVPSQDHESLAPCVACQERLDELPT